MKCCFYVKEGQQNQIHSLVKKHNLRYTSNPLECFGRWNFNIEGRVEDYNNFEKEKEELFPTIIEPIKKSFIDKILDFFFNR